MQPPSEQSDEIQVAHGEAVAVPDRAVPALLDAERGWLRALRHHEFRVFWAGNFVSNIGSWMQNVAQGWLVLQLTNSPLWLGIVGFVQQAPSLLFSLYAGVLADRTDRRRMLLVTQTIMMVLALVLAVLTHLKFITVDTIAVLAFLAGTTMAMNAPTYLSAVRDLVEREDTLNAIALNSIQFNSSRVIGPSLAGFVLAGMSIEACFYLNALSYVPLLYVIARTRFPQHAERQETSMLADVREAFHYVWTHRSVLWLLCVVAMVSMFGLPYLVMMPDIASNVLHVGARGLGYLVASAGLGALLGGLHLATLDPKRKRGSVVLVSAALFFIVVILFSFSRQPLLSALLLAIAGGTAVNAVATVNSLVQTVVPDHLRGRVISMHTMAFLGFTPIGSLLVGMIAERGGTPLALAVVNGIALLLTLLLAATAREVRALR